MAVNRIQLRGISRVPSDRMSRDGGLAESLNVQLVGEELAPMRAPEDVTEELLGQGVTVDGIVAYVHKGNGFANYIIKGLDRIYVLFGSTGESQDLLDNVSVDGMSVRSVGNVLIIRTDSGVYYFMRDGQRYANLVLEDLDLGGEFLCNDFRMFPDSPGFVPDEPTDPVLHQIWAFNTATWHSVLSKNESILNEAERKQLALIREYEARIWDEFALLKERCREAGYFVAPVLARYGVRLYDGSYGFVSAPVILGCGRYSRPYARVDTSAHRYYFGANVCWKGAVKFTRSISGDWKDLVASVDIFLSEDIIFPSVGSKIVDVKYSDMVFDGEQEDKVDAAEKAAFLAASNFYRIASLSVEDLEKLGGGVYDFLTERLNGRQEYRVTQPRFADDTRYGLVPNEIMNYNGRLLAMGASYKLQSGYGFLFGPSIDSVSDPLPLKIRFFVKKNGNEYTVDVNGGEYVNYPPRHGAGWGALFFPDAGCYKAELLSPDANKRFTIKMEEHPSLNCSYGYLGLTKNMFQMEPDAASEFSGEGPGLVVENNKIFMTRPDNFLVYEMGNTRTFDEDIIGAATIAKALITNPYGLADIYVFTKGGIYSIQIMRDGSFGSIYPYTRDVAVPGTISMIDHAVVFTTEKAVMLLSEAGLKDISQTMRGPHEGLHPSVADLIEEEGDTDFIPLLPLTQDDGLPFMAFMKEARAAYDYVGHRLIFFRNGSSYQYVFMLDTATWHKCSSLELERFSVLEGSADCLVSGYGVEEEQVSTLVISDIVGYPFYDNRDRSAAAGLLSTPTGRSEEALYDELASLPRTYDISSIGIAAANELLEDLERLDITARVDASQQVSLEFTYVNSSGSNPHHVAETLEYFGFGGYDDIMDALGDLPHTFTAVLLPENVDELEAILSQCDCTYTVSEQPAVIGITVEDMRLGGEDSDRQDVATLLAQCGVCADYSEAYAALNTLPHTFAGLLIDDNTISRLRASLPNLNATFTLATEHREVCTDGVIMDYSTIVDDDDYLSDTAHPVKGIVVTRPLAFDAPDIRKALRSLRIRGQMSKSDVRYILLGSMDGRSWARLSSLRGGSFKWFKIVLLTSLSPMERISWMDADVELRFENKLR